MDDRAGNAAKSPNDMLGLGIAGLGVASTMDLLGVAKFPRARIVAAADFLPNALNAFKRTYGGDCYETFDAKVLGWNPSSFNTKTPSTNFNEWLIQPKTERACSATNLPEFENWITHHI